MIARSISKIIEPDKEEPLILELISEEMVARWMASRMEQIRKEMGPPYDRLQLEARFEQNGSTEEYVVSWTVFRHSVPSLAPKMSEEPLDE